MIKERCWLFPNRLLSYVLSTLGQCLVSFQPGFGPPQTRIVPFLGQQVNIPNLELCSQPFSSGTFSNCLPTIVLLKDDRTNFVQEERLDRGTAAPVRCLQGSLVILVFMQMSQFRSFGKWVKVLCLPDTTFPRGSEADSREELAGASL